MRIWFDIDEVLSATWDHLLKVNNNEIKWVKFYREDWTEYYFFENKKLSWKITYEEWGELFANLFNDHLSIPTVDWVEWVVKKLKEDWHDIFVITARELDFEKHTEDWLNKNFWDVFESVHFIKSKNVTKWHIAEELNLDLFIEDHIEYCNTVAEKWIKTLLFDVPANRKHTELNENVERIHKMEQVLDIVEKLKKT